MGAEGCFGMSGNDSAFVTGAHVAVTDTTGAGDAFHAAFVHSMLTGFLLPECLTVANDIAAAKCTFLGPRIPSDVARSLTPQRTEAAYHKERWLRTVPAVRK